MNFQPQRLIVVQKEEGMEKLKNVMLLLMEHLLLSLFVEITMWFGRRQDNKDFLDIDVSIVTDHMMLEAADLGLASVWIGSFDPDMIKREFNLPDNVEAINILAIGYETDDNTKVDKNRKPLEEIVHYETY